MPARPLPICERVSPHRLTGIFYTSGNERYPLERKESDMTKKRPIPEQIVTLLRRVEVAVGNGKATPQACKEVVCARRDPAAHQESQARTTGPC